MKRTKRILSLLLALILATACFAGCSSSGGKESQTPDASSSLPESQAPQAGAEYEEWIYTTHTADLDSADPYGSTSAQMQKFTNLTFDNVTYVDADTGEIMPELAHSWKDINGDGKIWEFYLEDGVTFHNGDKFTAEDVKFTWEYAGVGQNNVIKPISAYSYVDTIEVVNDLTIRFTLNSGMADFPSYLETKIYSKKAFETMDAAEAAVIGTGMYYYDKAESISGTQFVATRYDNYWRGTDNYPTKHICFKVIADTNTVLSALQSGALDFYTGVSAIQYNTLINDSSLDLYTRSGAQSYYMGFNYAVPEMADHTIRKALCQAINKDDIVAVAFEGGLGGIANSNFCVPTGLGYAEITGLAYDKAAAEAVLKDKGLKLTLIYYIGADKIAEVIQSNLRDVGVEVTLQLTDGTNWTAIKASQEGYDIFIDYCAYQGALLYNFNRFFYSGGSSNVFGYYSAEYEALQDKVQNAATWEEMVKEFAVLQQFVADDIPIFPLAIPTVITAARKDVKGLYPAPSDNYQDFSTVYIPKR